MGQLDSGEWQIYLAGWVITDGNYADFAVGERRSFALEFSEKEVHEVPPSVRVALGRGEARYEVTAEVAFAADDLVLLDFGLLAYADSRPPGAIKGTWRSGEVTLGVDSYSYFEIHAKRPGIPPAVYPWTITGIWQETGPYIQDPDLGKNQFIRDPARRGYRSVDRTGTGFGGDPSPQYILRCRLEHEPPTFHP